MVETVGFAEYYDFDHALTLDVGFYLDFARRCGSPVLGPACGTGRLIVPLAEAGFEVHGIDLSDNMLAVCRRKVNEKLVDIFRDYEKNPSDGTGKIIAVVRRPN